MIEYIGRSKSRSDSARSLISSTVIDTCILVTKGDYNIMFPNESKYLKRGYASRDEQRLRRRSYRKLVKATIKKMLPILSVKL